LNVFKNIIINSKVVKVCFVIDILQTKSAKCANSGIFWETMGLIHHITREISLTYHHIEHNYFQEPTTS
jgi:hypothetical protein